ncbi:MAG: radical SAM protein [Gemmatimonadota bacterium]|nr:MAG: radical SAM protein [Gemmatimonadota bacterium]
MSERGNFVKIARITPHFGEEPVLTGTKGVGAIFLSGCNLRCVFCQNWQISHRRMGETLNTPAQLAGEMLKLQELGCHIIDLVSPSHQVKSLRISIRLAKEQGLTIPVVYNTNSLDNLDALRSLEGLIDIYLPDLKYSNDRIAKDLSKAHSYVSKSRASVLEMHRQVGHLFPNDEDALAQRGLIIRILVLPHNLSGCIESLQFIAQEIGPETWISLMAQYNPRPLFDSSNEAILKTYPALGRPITETEYENVLEEAQNLGFENIFIQECTAAVEYGSPDFEHEQPFVWDQKV